MNTDQNTSQQPQDIFMANMTMGDGTFVSIRAPSMALLAEHVGRLRPVAPAPAAKGKTTASPASTPAPASAPAETKKDEGNTDAGDAAKHLKQVQERVSALVKKIGRGPAIEQLNKFGASNASDMKPEKYLSFLAETATLLE